MSANEVFDFTVYSRLSMLPHEHTPSQHVKALCAESASSRLSEEEFSLLREDVRTVIAHAGHQKFFSMPENLHADSFEEVCRNGLFLRKDDGHRALVLFSPDAVYVMFRHKRLLDTVKFAFRPGVTCPISCLLDGEWAVEGSCFRPFDALWVNQTSR